jgi:hypothetical protein
MSKKLTNHKAVFQKETKADEKNEQVEQFFFPANKNLPAMTIWATNMEAAQVEYQKLVAQLSNN